MTAVKDQLDLLSRKLRAIRANIATEEATKTNLVMPFIQDVLGFNVFDVNEVIPEFIADVGLKKGEKIDFAIVNEGEVAMLIECKKVGENLSLENASQLYRYFNVTDARIAILTNGDEYRFYTDLDEDNRMDKQPFLELLISDLDATLVPEIEKLSKMNFNLDSVLSAAEELKYVSAAKRVFAAEYKELSDEMATLVIRRIFDGTITKNRREELTPLVVKGLQQFISDQVDRRLKTAWEDKNGADGADEEQDVVGEQVALSDDGIETTEEEYRALDIVRAIAAKVVHPDRIVMRDAKSYCPILLDDNNRQTVIRLRFNNPERLRIGLMLEDRSEEVMDIGTPSEIYRYSEEIRETLSRLI